MMNRSAALIVLLAGSGALANDWRELEAPLLTDHVQLTTSDVFYKAGEAYFSPDNAWIIFQAVPRPAAGEMPEPHYGMYAAELLYDDNGHVTGLGEATLLSPPGSANTCGWFHPTEPGRILFGSTINPPIMEEKPGFQVGTNKYVWQFPDEMDIVEVLYGPMTGSASAAPVTHPSPIFTRPGYDAESSWSSDGRFILYANVNPEKGGPEPDADLYIYNTETTEHTTLITADGYDGGPFFNADDTLICYRSDRAGDDRLQLYISELDYENGLPVGVTREVKLTANSHVNWAPFFHPDSASLIYTTSHVGHFNYEIFGIDATLDRPDGSTIGPRARGQRRVTFADGFDGLSVFSNDGTMMMWTSQRSADGSPTPGESQLWIARIPEGTTGADFAGPLTRGQALKIASDYAKAEGIRLGSGEPSARLQGRSWMVELPAEFGPARAFRVSHDSTVQALGGGD